MDYGVRDCPVAASNLGKTLIQRQNSSQWCIYLWFCSSLSMQT